MSNSESDVTEENIDFGSLLSEARKAQKYTVDQISEHIKIPAHYIIAIEASDISALPGATFARGYVRAYAKFLEVSDARIMEVYNRAAPQDQAKTLRPRSNLPGEASSQSPLFRAITMLLIIAGIAAVIYGSFQYYQEKADVMEHQRDANQQSFTGSSLDSPATERLNIRQDAGSADDESAADNADSSQEISELSTAAIDEQDTVVSEADGQVSSYSQPVATEAMEDKTIAENDVLEIFAENGSWMEVRDASKARLFYNTVPKGDTKVIQGKAPFYVSLGNAKTTRVLINDLEIDMAKYIRPNNTVSFTVSTEEQKVIIH